MPRLPTLLLLALGLAGCATTPPTAAVSDQSAKTGPAQPEGIFAEITTPRGLITCDLFYQKAPLTVASFVGLAEGTLGPAPRKPYFNGVTFHRIVPGFVIQGGDPTGTGEGGPGYDFPSEFYAGERHDSAGLLSMANSGPDTNGSQFFITLGPARYLDFVHPIFGRVVGGADVPAQILQGDTMSVKIVRRGRAAQRFRADEQAFAELMARAIRYPAPHLVDHATAAGADKQFPASYLEIRLTSLELFTGRHFFVHMAEKFEPESPGQTAQQFVDAQPAKLHLPAGAVLACYFSEEDAWYLGGAKTGLHLPQLTPPPPPRTPATTPDAVKRQKQRVIYNQAEQVVSALVDQTDPK